MNFISPPPANYNPEKSRVLLESASRGLEIENARRFPHWLRDPWVDRVLSSGLELIENRAASLYLDTPNLDIYSNGLSNRVRTGAVVYNGKGEIVQTFENQFTLKSIHSAFQEAALIVAKRLYPQYQNAGVYPIVRNEIEGQHGWRGSVKQLRLNDLPHQPWHGHDISITEAIEGLIAEGKIAGISDPKDFVLVPWIATVVDRQRIDFFVEPGDKFDFIKSWPSPEPTAKMKRTGEYLCIEAVVDRLAMKFCKANSTIDEAITAPGNKLGRRSLIEYEVMAPQSGNNLTDQQAIGCYIEFGIGMLNFAQEISQRRKKLIGPETFAPTRSKMTTSLGRLTACQPGGTAHTPYVKGFELGW